MAITELEKETHQCGTTSRRWKGHGNADLEHERHTKQKSVEKVTIGQSTRKTLNNERKNTEGRAVSVKDTRRGEVAPQLRVDECKK